MPRDYKRKKRSNAGTDASPWRWLAAGFGLGMVAALVLYQQLKPTVPEAFTDGDHATYSNPGDSDTQNSSTATAVDASSAARTPLTPADKPVASKPETVLKKLPKPGTPDYDFYSMLPNFEVVVADSQPINSTSPKDKPASIAKSATNSADNRVHFLQAGSFRKFADADRRKAQLALQGIESNIHQVTIKNAIWFRVYVGPTRDLARLDRARTTLAYADIETMLIRVKQ